MARRASATERLKTYRAKRRFDATPEPKGGRAGGKGLVYAIQKHDTTRLHYDLRLELDGVLLSWAITRGPSLDPSQKRLAVRTEDHPMDYAMFEGTIPEGNYGAGTVLLWDRGTWEPLEDPRQGLDKGKLVFRLHGERLKGRWALVRFRGGKQGRSDAKRENWLLIKELDDEVARDRDVLETYRTSVKTKRGLKAIAEGDSAVWKSGKAEKPPARKAAARIRPRGGKLPAFAPLALATLVDRPPEGKDWLFEMKFDGYRALLAVQGDDVRISTRNGLDWTNRFRPLADAAASLGLHGALIDGEVVVLDDEGRSDFSALQAALDGESRMLSFFAFDLLAEGGKGLRKAPLVERKRRLAALLGKAGRRGPIFFTDHVEADGAAMLDALCRRGFEGIVAKRAQAPYRAGRVGDWLKVKCGRQQEFVIGGWSPSDKSRAFSSILLGLREKGRLRYAGRVGSGFGEDDLADLGKRFARLARPLSPFAERVPGPIGCGAHWVDPKLVAEIAFAGFTGDGMVRQGRFLGLREDKPASAVTREEPKPVEEAARSMRKSAGDVTIRGVRLSHLDKVLYAEQGLTKHDLARYYDKVAPVMMPIVAGRLVSLVRCPEGSGGQCFFQRHGSGGLPDAFARHPVAEQDGGKEDYVALTGPEALIAAAQVGVLEVHIWGSRVDDIERPDRLVLDLDPAPDLDFCAVAAAAEEMRDALAALGLKSFPLLTGGKGIHVVAPIARKHEWPVVKAAARALAERFAKAEPTRYIATMAKAKRKGRIFIDYLRNERGATAVAPFSPRARAGAPVAWPVSWAELAQFDAPNAVTIADVLEGRRKPKPWPGYAKLRQSLTAAALKALGV